MSETPTTQAEAVAQQRALAAAEATASTKREAEEIAAVLKEGETS